MVEVKGVISCEDLKLIQLKADHRSAEVNIRLGRQYLRVELTLNTSKCACGNSITEE